MSDSHWCSELSCNDEYMVSIDTRFVPDLDKVNPSVTSSNAPLVKVNLKSDLCLFSDTFNNLSVFKDATGSRIEQKHLYSGKLMQHPLMRLSSKRESPVG